MEARARSGDAAGAANNARRIVAEHADRAQLQQARQLLDQQGTVAASRPLE